MDTLEAKLSSAAPTPRQPRNLRAQWGCWGTSEALARPVGVICFDEHHASSSSSTQQRHARTCTSPPARTHLASLAVCASLPCCCSPSPAPPRLPAFPAAPSPPPPPPSLACLKPPCGAAAARAPSSKSEYSAEISASTTSCPAPPPCAPLPCTPLPARASGAAPGDGAACVRACASACGAGGARRQWLTWRELKPRVVRWGAWWVRWRAGAHLVHPVGCTSKKRSGLLLATLRSAPHGVCKVGTVLNTLRRCCRCSAAVLCSREPAVE